MGEDADEGVREGMKGGVGRLILLCSAGAALGALAVASSAVSLRFLLDPSDRAGSPEEHEDEDEDEDRDKEGPRCPFDPSKRKG